MNLKKQVCLLLLVAFLAPWALKAQCGNFGSYDNPTCNEVTRTFGSVFTCPSGHCRWDFTYSGTLTLFSRTANTITLYNGRSTPLSSLVLVTMYDSINNCTGTMDWTDRYMQQTFPDIVGTIPVCPVPLQVYEYTVNRFPSFPSAPAQESITWSITGGTIQSTSNSPLFAAMVYDTVRVLWNASGPRRLIANRLSSGTTSWGPQMCTNRDTIWDGSAPPVISGANALCGTAIGNYSIPGLDPAFTYSWSCSNGSITAGQGTANVTVTWLGSGVLTLTRTAVGCGWTDAVTKNVTISAGAAPTPVLPPTASACSGQSVALYPGAFTTYQWSNLNTAPSIAPTASGTYTVTVTNAAGCQATASSVVTISGSAPVPNLGPNQSVCAGTVVTLNPGTFTGYLWSTGATTQTISPSVSGTYSVTVTNASGCTATDNIVLTFNALPVPNLGPNQTVCTGTGVTLNPGIFTSYLWSTGATTQTISPTTAGTYSVTVTGAGGCTGNTSVNLTFNPSPSPNLGPNQSACAGTPTTLNPGTFSSYLWSTGATTQTISPSTSGTYSVTVTGANGCTGTDNVVLTFNALPVPNLGPNQTVCTGTGVTLNPGIFTSYLWSTGATTQTISPTTAGTYSVTVTNASGCTGNTSVNLTFNPSPSPNLGPNQSVCAGTPTTLNPGTFSSYLWSTGATTQTISPSTSGTYSVTVTGANGCTATDNVVLTFNALPTPNLGFNQTVCAGTPVTLNPGTFSTYLWSTGATTSTISPSVSGTYTVTVTNASGCTGTDNVVLTFNALPTPNLGPNQTACTGTPVTLNPGTFSTYLWSTGATTSTISPIVSGIYSVTVTNANGCTGTDNIALLFNASPTPNLGPNQTVCAGTPVTLNPGTFTSYLWSTGATTSTISPSVSGIYSVTVTNANGCTGTDNVTLTFNALPAPNLGFNQTVCAGTPVTLNPGTFSSYLWSTGATTSTISPGASGTYSVTVTNASGCTGTDNVVLTFNPLSAFSLGNDTLICADTILLIDGPAGTYTYLWSTGATGASITISTGGTYQLTITDANGCTASDAITITGLTDCVFPGDANYDGVANNLDVLSIGAYYNTAGPVRPGASTNWFGQSLADWGGALPGQADPKHSDCNGDGIVLAVDTLAVALNYAKTHNKAAAVSSGDNLYVVPLQDSISPGDTAWFAIHLGEQNNLADSVYGVAFSVQHSGTGVLQPGIISVVYANCWFAPALSRLDFTHSLGAMAGLDLAITRTDQLNQIGFGEVCRIAILTDPSPAGQNVPLTVTLTQPVLVDAGLNPIAVLPVPGSTVVSTTLNSISGPGVNPRIYPNPADGMVRIELPQGQLERVEVYDALGKMQFSVDGQGAQSIQVMTAGWSQGMYLLRVHTDTGVFTQRQAIGR